MGWEGPMTHRQLLLWEAWRNEEWDVPSRTDWYLMAIRAELQAANSRRHVTIPSMHLPLKVRDEDEDRQQAKVNDGKFLAAVAMGGRIRRRIRHPDGTIEELPDIGPARKREEAS